MGFYQILNVPIILMQLSWLYENCTERNFSGIVSLRPNRLLRYMSMTSSIDPVPSMTFSGLAPTHKTYKPETLERRTVLLFAAHIDSKIPADIVNTLQHGRNERSKTRCHEKTRWK